MDLEQPRGIGGRLVALRYHLADFNLLLRRQFRTAAADAPLFAGGIQSSLGPLFEQRPFELGERPDHLHHHSACWCGRVDGFGQTAESRSGFPKPLHNREHVAKRPRQPVEFPDYEHITLAQLVEQPVKFWPIPTSTGRLLPVDPLTSSGLERRHLDGGVLIVGGDSGVADLQCSNVSPIELVTQYLFATQEAQQINFLSGGCTTGRLRNTASARKSPRIGAIGRSDSVGANFRIHRHPPGIVGRNR